MGWKCFFSAALAADPTSSGKKNGVILDEGQSCRFSLHLEESGSPVRLEMGAEDKEWILEIVPGKADANPVVVEYQSEDQGARWKEVARTVLPYRPEVKGSAVSVEEGTVQSAYGKPLRVRTQWSGGHLQIWVDGQLVFNRVLTVKGVCRIDVRPEEGMGESGSDALASGKSGAFLEADLSHLIPGRSARRIEVDGIPFEVWDNKSAFSMSQAGWPEWQKDPGTYIESYDAGPAWIGDPRLPLIQVPRADYTAAYLLVEADPDPGTGNEVTLRVGRRKGGSKFDSQVLLRDFGAAVPRGSGFQVVRIPFTEALAQRIEGGVMDIELTKELRLARRSPDPCRFRWRPLGLPSGVRVAAVTLERSPLQLELIPEATGSLFEEPHAPRYKIRLRNTTDHEQTFAIDVQVDGAEQQTVSGSVPPQAEIEKDLDLGKLPLGYHRLNLTLKNSEGAVLFSRPAAFGCLPADDRKYRSASPLGTWQFNGQHFTPLDDDREVADLHRKLGLRYGLFGATPETRREFGVIKGNEFTVTARRKGNPLEDYAKLKSEHPDLLPDLLLFHEDSISGPHVTRVPDLFHDRPPFKLNEAERVRFEEFTRIAEEAARAFRKEHPEVKISLGNGPAVLREEFYRNGFPAELFDTAGNEAGSFGRPPETQPPDWVANNAGIWMDRQLLEAYGYGDKEVSQCFETTYPCDNPGNLSSQTQADYYVRHILHSMAWRIPRIRVGCLVDVGNSYYYSNWGASGFFTARPLLEPKPAALAVATLSRVLDGAQFEDFVDTGSESAYLLRFRKPDGPGVLVYWVVRGEREWELDLEGASAVRLTEWDGPSTDVKVSDGKLRISASATPRYLELPRGATVQGVRLGEPIHEAAPEGKVAEIDALDSLEGWEVVSVRNPELEFYNPLCPRRKGDFEFEVVETIDGGGPAIRVTPKPLTSGKDTMPMVVELAATKDIVLPGKPTEIGLWVNGNSGWGRIIYELEDASGQRWTSIGAKAAEESAWMADWLSPEMMEKYRPNEIADWNTDDPYGLSRINFDGWRYVGFPLPGQYPGEGYHWPANSQWKSTGDGVVHYPLKLKKLIIELPEKVLHLTRYAPPKRPDVFLRRLVTVEQNNDAPKQVAGEYVEARQIDYR